MLYDSADCVQRCRDHAQLPLVDESMDDPAWYRLLSTAQRFWYLRIASVAPAVLQGDPVLLSSDDGGVTYSFGVDENNRPLVPLGGVALYRQESDAYEAAGAAVWAMRPGIDYRVDGDRVRFSARATPSFPDGGPWAVFVTPPSDISNTQQPVLQPIEARELMVLSAVVQWASQGDLRDPSPFKQQIADLWRGTGPGDLGLLGALKTQHFGNAAPPRRGYGAGRGGYGQRRAY